MPFERGSFALKILTLPKTLPDNALELFNKNCAGKIEEIKNEPQIGWVSGRHLLERVINEETAILGGHIYLNLRVAVKKIPASLLKAELKMEELVYMKANGVSIIPRKVKKEIHASVEEKMLSQAVPAISGIPFIIDGRDNIIYLGATSTGQLDTFLVHFQKTFDFLPVEINSEGLMLSEKMKPSDYKGMVLFGSKEDDYIAGRDFLTWLWFFSEERSGEIDLKKYGKFSIMIDGPLTFISDGQGALESSVKKGNPLKSGEARTALNLGKKLKKAKIIIAREDETWQASFDADSFVFSGVTLPPGEEMENNSRFAERVDYIQNLKDAMIALFKLFLSETNSEKWPETINAIKQWIEKRESF